MPIVIGSGLKSKIVDSNERENIEELLKQKAADICFLCRQPLNISTEKIVADHDIPEVENGPTNYDNLNLVHDSCNSFKSANSTLRIRKFLPLRRFLIDNPGSNYEQVSERLLEVTNHEVYFKHSDGLIYVEDVHITEPFGPFKVFTEEINGGSPVQYIFARLPIKYLYNDDVQPRSIKVEQAFKIFQDLHVNPLHEPVGARLQYPLDQNLTSQSSINKILMFDGQHKTVSRALFNEEGMPYESVAIDIKIYVNFSHEQAVKLVNSIQSLVPKLGLTKSEFAKKMAEECGPLFENYLKACSQSHTTPSEKGFVASASPQDRNRYKKAIQQSRLTQLMLKEDGSEIDFMKLLHSKDRNWQIKETTLFNKVFQKYLITKQLELPIDDDDTHRTTERRNIQKVLQLIYEELLTVTASNPKENIKIFLTQSGLALIGDLTKHYIHYILMTTTSERDFFDPNFEQKVEEKLRAFYVKFRSHPIWNYQSNYQGIQKVERFYNRILQNQSLMEIGESICLNLVYCSGLQPLGPNCLRD